MASSPRSLLLALCLLIVLADGRVYVRDVVTGQTNENDVSGLQILILQYPQLYELVDDPCYPFKLTWINCSDDASPRVTALYLSSRILFGTLPDFSSMDALEIIDLHNNILTGFIPEFLGKFPTLRELNLANNAFTGPIPSSLAQNKNLKKDFSGNPGLTTSSSPSPTTGRTTPSSRTPEYSSNGSSEKKSNKLPIILGITIPVFAVIWIAIGVFAFMRQRERTEAAIRAAAAQSNASGTTNTPVEEKPINQQHGETNP